MKILNMVILIVMHFYGFVSNWNVSNRKKLHFIQLNLCIATNILCKNEYFSLTVTYHEINAMVIKTLGNLYTASMI